MKNKYVNFISDKHLLECIGNLHDAYVRAKNNITKENFYSNKVDTIKLTFDAKFNDISEESLIQSEILRQIDKSINNSIGTFHEEILGGIKGYEIGESNGCDIEAKDKSLFADIHHNTISQRSSESLFNKLTDQVRFNKQAKAYWVQFYADSSFSEKWVVEFPESRVSCKSVFKISGDQFYALLSGQKDAFARLHKVLPKAIEDYLETTEKINLKTTYSVFEEIKVGMVNSKKSIIDQINFENYGNYMGFGEL